MHKPLDVSFAFRVSQEAADKLKQVADAHGIAPSAYARKVVLDAVGRASEAPPVRRRVMNAELLRDALGQLLRMGSNLNQIARGLNRGGTFQAAIADLEVLRGTHDAAMRAVINAVGGD